MSQFDEDDLTLLHERRADRSGYLRLTHQPTGLFVDAHLTSQPVLKVKEELVEALRCKVLAHDVLPDHPAIPETRTVPQASMMLAANLVADAVLEAHAKRTSIDTPLVSA